MLGHLKGHVSDCCRAFAMHMSVRRLLLRHPAPRANRSVRSADLGPVALVAALVTYEARQLERFEDRGGRAWASLVPA